MSWSTAFDDPVDAGGKRRLLTLQQAADYIMQLPEDAQHQTHWQTAIETLIQAAETGGGWVMFARIAMLRALHADEGRR
ncbi:hypothetical protein JQ554_22270 [Bradyrhizobium diazoefficiens]|nr:hypothetical protein [Bradyrhizobium diazoefficiens]UCF54585.1 MAG: hypothetical protein JSV48_10250 [Bradyrhizobium sp.]MBR0966773.1 hypothetical protein [Bradyrhizobium diazoefficiens]MBR0980411.1 hypothetical protein [Bradyrhizobium diazoefficiens]MBR1009759.1 hypothetical protein [Bradyrhizobium diazoefficiens]MBR1016342.1 hypothetical protein [Bradyrhizobium diazoefficiens]